MRTVRFSINVTLDGCYDHTAVVPDEELHHRSAALIEEADEAIFGRVTYQMMEEAWRAPRDPDAFPEWTEPFAQTIDAIKKYVASSTLTDVDWNAELLQGDVADAVRALKERPGGMLFVGGVQLAKSLTAAGLIDEYVVFVHPRIVGHGPYLFSELAVPVDLRLVDRQQMASGAMVLTYARVPSA